MAELITLDNRQIKEAARLASLSFERYRFGKFHYRNSWKKHFIGRLSETAVEIFYLERQIELIANFRDANKDNLCDLERFDGHPLRRIEVKCWTLKYWEEGGRCVEVNQLPKIERKADAIIWCKLTCPARNAEDANRLDGLTVDLDSYSVPIDLRQRPSRSMVVCCGDPVENYQVPQNSVRSLDGLFANALPN